MAAKAQKKSEKEMQQQVKGKFALQVRRLYLYRAPYHRQTSIGMYAEKGGTAKGLGGTWLHTANAHICTHFFTALPASFFHTGNQSRHRQGACDGPAGLECDEGVSSAEAGRCRPCTLLRMSGAACGE